MATEKLEIGDVVVWTNKANPATIAHYGHGPFIIASHWDDGPDEYGDPYYKLKHMDGKAIDGHWSWTIKKDVFLNEVHRLSPGVSQLLPKAEDLQLK